LIGVLWYRCILDEAQMVEAPLSQVASVSKMIPRWYSWAVTGTPIKDNLNDLYGLYDFLSLERTIHKAKHFQTLCSEPQFKQDFYEFARMTMRRNTKQLLAEQIHIPRQHRHVVRIPFSTIEQHYYDDLWRACRNELQLDWLDSINWTLPPNSQEDTASEYRAILLKMRGWLLALRQNCIHPSLITNDTVRLANQTNGFKRVHSLAEVLEGMKEAAAHRLDGNQYALYFLRLKRGGMYEVLKDWQNALASYTNNVPFVEELVDFHMKQVELKKQGEEGNASNAAMTLNRWQLLLHMYYFYMAGVYHTTGAQESEDLYYTKAADLRRALLRISTSKVLAHLDELKQTSDQICAHKRYVMGSRLLDNSLINELTHDDHAIVDGEIPEHGERLGKADDLNVLENVKHIGTILDRQFEKILYLRKKILPILEKSLVDTKDDTAEATGDEYQDSLNDQEFCQVYISAYEALLRDRKFIVKGITATLYDTIADNDVNNGAFVSEVHSATACLQEKKKTLVNLQIFYRVGSKEDRVC
jgi:E3 ubiquitin-protein ligase SHPRH